MYNYYELIAICETISGQLDTVINSLQTYFPPILYSIFFYIVLKVGFTCLRGYKV